MHYLLHLIIAKSTLNISMFEYSMISYLHHQGTWSTAASESPINNYLLFNQRHWEFGSTLTHMPGTSGCPAASFANPIGCLIVWKHLAASQHFDSSHLAEPCCLPCSISLLERTLKTVSGPKCNASTSRAAGLETNFFDHHPENCPTKVNTLHHPPNIVCL